MAQLPSHDISRSTSTTEFLLCFYIELRKDQALHFGINDKIRSQFIQLPQVTLWVLVFAAICLFNRNHIPYWFQTFDELGFFAIFYFILTLPSDARS